MASQTTVSPLVLQQSANNANLFNQQMSSAYDNFSQIFDPDEALAKDPNIFNKMLRDPSIFHARQARTHSVARKEWLMEPASDDPQDMELADLMGRAFKKIRNFTAARKELADAAIVGRSAQFIEGRMATTKLGLDQPRRWWVPTQLKDIDKRRFRFVPSKRSVSNGDMVIDIHEELWSVANREYRRIDNPERFIRITYSNSEDRLGYGHGLLSVVYFFWTMRGAVLREGLQAIKRWAQGQVVVQIDQDRAASENKTNADIVATTKSEIAKTRSDNVLVLSKDDLYTIHEPSGRGSDMAREQRQYFDDWITRVITGSLRPTGGGTGSTGARAQAETEQDNSEIIYDFDREIIDEAITEYLVPFWRKMNRANLEALGLGDAENPRFRTMPLFQDDPTQAATVAEVLLRNKVPLTRESVYRKTGYPMPKEGEPIFEGAPAPAPAAPTGPLGFKDNGS